MMVEKKLIQYFYTLYKDDCIILNCPPDISKCDKKGDKLRCGKCWDGFIRDRYKEFFKEEGVIEKPPVGVVPEYIHRQCRMEELSNAIDSHIQTGCIGKGYIEDLLMWIKELHKHILWYTLRERGKSNGRFKSV